jgi:hypothetical protein
MNRRLVCIVIALAGISSLTLLWADRVGVEQPATGPATRPATQPDSRCPLRLSELKLDGVDGTDSWWVELYNTSNQAFDAAGVTIVVNGKVIATIGLTEAGKANESTKVPARGLLLVQVDSKKQDASPRNGATRPKYLERPVVTVIPPTPKEPPAPQRQVGYCAIFTSAELTQDGLIDYVQWGWAYRAKPRPNWPHSKWAAQRGLWPLDDGIPIGLFIAPGESGPPPLGSSICRYQFASQQIGRKMWMACPPKYATPGACNVVPPPLVHSPFGGHAADGPLCVSFMWLDIPPLLSCVGDNSAKTPYHFQIAADAMFEEIVLDIRYSGGVKSIPQGQLKNGDYWARVRYDSPKLSTSWSHPRPFSYR